MTCQLKQLLIDSAVNSNIINAFLLIYDKWQEQNFKRFKYYRQNIDKIRLLKDRYEGKRCFIIGNGPSLKDTDLELLKDEYTFGQNKIYMLFDKTIFRPKFMVATNPHIVDQSSSVYNNLEILKFFSYKTKNSVIFDKHTHIFLTSAHSFFGTDLAKIIWEGATVTYVSMQIAYYLGFKKIYLIGVDHSYVFKGKRNEEKYYDGINTNHFDNNYFSRGQKWNVPDLIISEKAYKMARNFFEKSNIEIKNATIGGDLEIFDRVDYLSLFKN